MTAPYDRPRILAYAAVLVLLVEFGAPYNGLIDVPVTFFLKNRLHLAAHEISLVRVIGAVPIYLAFLIGLARDRFNPFRRGDRGFLMLFGLITAAAYGMLAFAPITRIWLMIGVFSLNVVYLFLAAAMRALISVLGQGGAMTGRLTTVWYVVLAIPLTGTYLAGGWLSQMIEGANSQTAARVLFLVGAAVSLSIAGFGAWKPAFVFDHAPPRPEHPQPLMSDLARLLRHRPLWPALLIQILWEVSPGAQTVLQVHMTNVLHATDWQWGVRQGIYFVAFVPTYLLYGFLCRRMAFRPLLIISTLIGIPQMAPLIFTHSAEAAMWWAIPIGLMGGMCTTAYADLLMRSCPPGLQGTAQGFALAAFWAAWRIGDLFGTWIYDRLGNDFHGFVVCAWVTIATYAAILPVIWFMVPKSVTAAREGEDLGLDAVAA